MSTLSGILGVFLFIEGLGSIVAHPDDPLLWQVARAVRMGIGACLMKQ